MLQIGTLEVLIGWRLSILRRWLVRVRWIPITWSLKNLWNFQNWLMADCITVVVLACQVGLFHLTLTYINSEMNFIAKNKCPDSHACVKTKNMCDMCALFFHSQSLIYSMWGKKCVRKSYFHFCWMFELLLECGGSVIRSHEDLIRFNNNIPWLARTIYNYVNVLFVFVFSVIQVKHQKIWLLFLFCWVFVLLL